MREDYGERGVARNSPSARNAVQAGEARNAANKANVRNEAAGTATSESAESTMNKKAENIKISANSEGSGNYNPNAARTDNTFVKKPIMF